MNISPFGPIFLSYRQSDGLAHARALAWALRSAGAPVWHDDADLPPGDTTQRLSEALASGLSGAVLLVTPEIEKSTVVRKVELPQLLQLEGDPSFTFLVTTEIPDAGDPGKVDFRAADRLLHKRRGTLSRLKQWPLFGEGALERIARQMVLRRMEAFSKLGRDEIVVEIQSRFEAGAEYAGSPLLVRTRPPEPGRRVPPPEIWKPFGAFLANLPQLLRTAQARNVVVQGGAHPSISFALGAALPLTTPWGPNLSVKDQFEERWPSKPGSPAPELAPDLQPCGPAGAPLAVYIDLLRTPAPCDAFEAYVAPRRSTCSATLSLVLRHRRNIEAHEGGALAQEISRHIREAASARQTHRVYLFLRAPFAIPVLLGQRLNTLEITLHEWEDGDGPLPHYLEAATIASGRGNGPVLAAARSTAL